MLTELVHATDMADALRKARGDVRDHARIIGIPTVVCYDGWTGDELWRETVKNLVVNEGLNLLLQATLTGGTRSTVWFVGLKGTGAPAAGDTMASHATWAEITGYDETTRRTWTPNAATVTGQSTTNSTAKAIYTMNGSFTVAGVFLTDSNTKGGTTGLLYAAANFGASQAVVATNILEVTYTFTTSV